MEKHSTTFPVGQSYGGTFFTQGFFPQVAVACVKVTKKTDQDATPLPHPLLWFLTSLQTLPDIGNFSLHWKKMLVLIFQASLLRHKRLKETDEDSLVGRFFKTISWFIRQFSCCIPYLHIENGISPSFLHSHCNKWFPFVINPNLPSADGYFRSIIAKLMSSCI